MIVRNIHLHTNWQPNTIFRRHIYFLAQPSWNCGMSKAVKDTSMLPSNLDQKKVPLETGSKAEFGFGRPFLPWNAASKGNIVELSDATMNLLLNWQSQHVIRSKTAARTAQYITHNSRAFYLPCVFVKIIRTYSLPMLKFRTSSARSIFWDF